MFCFLWEVGDWVKLIVLTGRGWATGWATGNKKDKLEACLFFVGYALCFDL